MSAIQASLATTAAARMIATMEALASRVSVSVRLAGVVLIANTPHALTTVVIGVHVTEFAVLAMLVLAEMTAQSAAVLITAIAMGFVTKVCVFVIPVTRAKTAVLMSVVTLRLASVRHHKHL